MREASNGGASGRVCADIATRFPISKTSAAKSKAVFHPDFHGIAILRSVQSFESEFRQAYIYTLARSFQTKNASRTVSWNKELFGL
jgi:hypothetical protein